MAPPGGRGHPAAAAAQIEPASDRDFVATETAQLPQAAHSAPRLRIVHRGSLTWEQQRGAGCAVVR